MSAINIITLIAIILFARLGVRLFFRYRKMKKEEQEEQEEQDANNDAQQKE